MKNPFPPGSTGSRQWKWNNERKPKAIFITKHWHYQCQCGCMEVWKYRGRLYCGNCGLLRNGLKLYIKRKSIYEE